MKRILTLCAVLALGTSAHANYLVNGGFENGMTGWTKDAPFGNSQWDDPAMSNPHGLGIDTHSGMYMASAISGWDTSRNNSVIYQSFDNPGGYTRVSFWGRAYNKFLENPVSPFDTGVQIGFDPTGSEDIFSSDIVWADAVWANNTWTYSELVFPNVAAGKNTVYIRSIHKFGIEWNVSLADDVEVVPEPSSLLAMATGLVAAGGALIRKKR